MKNSLSFFSSLSSGRASWLPGVSWRILIFKFNFAGALINSCIRIKPKKNKQIIHLIYPLLDTVYSSSPTGGMSQCNLTLTKWQRHFSNELVVIGTIILKLRDVIPMRCITCCPTCLTSYIFFLDSRVLIFSTSEANKYTPVLFSLRANFSLLYRQNMCTTECNCAGVHLCDILEKMNFWLKIKGTKKIHKLWHFNSSVSYSLGHGQRLGMGHCRISGLQCCALALSRLISEGRNTGRC